MNTDRGVAKPIDVERKIFRTFWDDGLIDTVVGAGILLIGIAWRLDLALATVVVPLLLLPVWMFARGRISIPRAGFVRFSKDHGERTHRVTVILGLVGYGVLAAFGAAYLYFVSTAVDMQLPEAVLISVPTASVAIIVLLSRFLFGMPNRAIVYGLLIFVVAVIGGWLNMQPGTQFVVAGACMTVSGVTMLLRFIRRHPVMTEQSESEAS